MEQIVLALLSAAIGFIVGILINALADGLPDNAVLRPPRYPDGSPRPAAAWSGTLAFLNGQRANSAGSRLSWRQPLVELSMALLFGFVVLNWPGHDRTIVWLVYLSILMLVTVIDLEHRLIITPVILLACILALVVAAVFPEPDRDFANYLAGGGLGLGMFLVMYWGGAVFSNVAASLRGEELGEVAFGFGDVYLATLCGLMIGWQALIFAAIITVFLGAVGGVLFLTIQALRGQYSAFTPLPYGPYIVLGTVIMMLWREDIGSFLRGE
jgi:leader peptidase (prepilin peptidase)/N-methyltransferase